MIDGNSLLKTEKSYHDINSIMITFDQEISNEEIPRKNEDITMRIIIRQTSRLRYTKKFSLFEIAPSRIIGKLLKRQMRRDGPGHIEGPELTGADL